MFGVAVHEFGHSIGLGHSTEESAIMFPWYHGYHKLLELSKDDREAIQQIYGAPEREFRDFTTKSTSTTTQILPRHLRTTAKPYRFDIHRKRFEYERERKRLDKEWRQRQYDMKQNKKYSDKHNRTLNPQRTPEPTSKQYSTTTTFPRTTLRRNLPTLKTCILNNEILKSISMFSNNVNYFLRNPSNLVVSLVVQK